MARPRARPAVVQIVDARNPLLFRSEDLERYVAEIDPSKRCVLLVNKADLLSHAQRAAWARYFSAHSIEFVFWSAAAAQEAIEEEARRERGAWVAEMGGLGRGKRHAAAKQAAQQAAAKEEEQDDDEEGEDGEEVTPLPRAAAPEKAKEEEEEEDEEDEDDEDEDAMLMRLAGAQAGRSKAVPALPEMDDDDDDDESDDEEGDGSAAGADEDDGRALQAAVDAPPQKDATHVHTREELLALLRTCPRQPRASQGAAFVGRTIGLVGHPNVGKSSTVNVLAHEKKTSVSSTPGKTKHFQTLSVPDAPVFTLATARASSSPPSLAPRRRWSATASSRSTSSSQITSRRSGTSSVCCRPRRSRRRMRSSSATTRSAPTTPTCPTSRTNC